MLDQPASNTDNIIVTQATEWVNVNNTYIHGQWHLSLLRRLLKATEFNNFRWLHCSTSIYHCANIATMVLSRAVID